MEKSKIAISVESAADLSEDLLKKYQIKVIPLSITLGDKTDVDGVISPLEVLEYCENHKDLPKTSAVNEYQYEEYFKTLLKEYEVVIHISLSSTISSCYNNAKNVSSRIKNVFVIDSLNLSTGIALSAIYARTLIDEGKLSVEEVVNKVEERKKFVQTSFYLETIDNLYKGGRCSAVAMIGAKILRIKPQIIMSQTGEMNTGSMYFGRKNDVANSYVEDTLKKFPNADKSLIFVTHSHAPEAVVETVKQNLQAKGFKNILETQAGSTITTHCGRNCLGILYFKDGVETLK